MSMFQFRNNVTNFRNPQSQRDDNWKADAFINIMLPTRNGKSRKLGSIALKMSKPAEAELIQYLAEDAKLTEARIAEVFSTAQVTFNLAEGNPDSGFAFGDKAPAAAEEDEAVNE